MSQKTTKIIAIIALACLVVSVIWTGLLFIFSWNNNTEREFSPEELEQMKAIIESQSWAIIDITDDTENLENN